MAVTDQELELMEQWLDGELPEGQAEALRARISGEPELAQVVDRLRGDRKMRAAIFSALEPANHDVDALINNVRRAVRKEEVWGSRMRILRNVSGVAAALAMVFFAGWISRSKLHVGPLPESINLPSPAIVVYVPNPSAGPTPANAPAENVGTGSLASYPRASDGFSAQRPKFKIVLADPMGRGIHSKDLEGVGNVADAQRLWVEFVNFANKHPGPPATQPLRPPQPTLVDQPAK
jgi:hypothetical protein